MQEDIEHRSIALSIKAAKLTARLLAKAIRALLREIHTGATLPFRGKQSVRQLAKQDAGMTNIEITDDNIKGFERFARKYGVDFALKRDGAQPPRWLVFFKGRDADAIMAAFSEFTRETLKRGKRPSVREAARGAEKAEPSAEKSREPKQRVRTRGEKGGPVR